MIAPPSTSASRPTSESQNEVQAPPTRQQRRSAPQRPAAAVSQVTSGVYESETREYIPRANTASGLPQQTVNQALYPSMHGPTFEQFIQSIQSFIATGVPTSDGFMLLSQQAPTLVNTPLEHSLQGGVPYQNQGEDRQTPPTPIDIDPSLTLIDPTTQFPGEQNLYSNPHIPAGTASIRGNPIELGATEVQSPDHSNFEAERPPSHGGTNPVKDKQSQLRFKKKKDQTSRMLSQELAKLPVWARKSVDASLPDIFRDKKRGDNVKQGQPDLVAQASIIVKAFGTLAKDPGNKPVLYQILQKLEDELRRWRGWGFYETRTIRGVRPYRCIVYTY